MKKNTKARLNKVNQSLEKALDFLHKAQGEMYPQELVPYRQSVTEAIESLEQLREIIDAALVKPSDEQAKA